MASIKGVNRSACVALSSDSPYMATGTMAGAVDLTFSSTSSLDIFKLDFVSNDHELPLMGECSSSERFNRLSWSKNRCNSEEYSLGLIASSLTDGNIGLWNPATMIWFVVWNLVTPNLLASGADDGEICIWDLASPKEPSHFPPLRGVGSAAQSEISFLAWNSKVQQILASTSYNGTTAVWDLRKQKAVISFVDSTRRRCSVLQWNPEVATHLVVASDDDNSPTVRLWDMRDVTKPVKEFVGHTRGVISMAWCPNDSSYLLTCSKDNRTICWDTVSGEIVCELPAGTNWNFDLHWYSKIPGLVSASSFDGKVGIYNIEACSRYGVAENDFGSAPLRAPKWYKRPVGVSFGFAGKLLSFHSKVPTAGTPVKASEVYVHSLITEDSLVTRSSEFEAAIKDGERSSLKFLCEKKSQASKSDDDRETWGFLKVMLEDDGTARTNLLSHLGFSAPEEETINVQDDLSQQFNSLGLEDNGPDETAYITEKETTSFSYDNGEDFFNNLPSPKAETPASTSVNFFVEEAIPSEQQGHIESDRLEKSDDPAFDDAVQRALVVGDYKGAVAQCVSANKMADALVIAHVGGVSLWESILDQYLKMSCSPYLKVVSAMVNHDLMSLVKSRSIESWKETLALLCSFAQGEEWTMLCDALASKLLAGGNTLAATLCYICAGNIDKTVEIWSQRLSAEPEGKSYVDSLQDLMEKTIVFALASGQKRFSSFLCKLVENYAEILASQGQLSTAMEYLKLLGEEVSSEIGILRDRITLSLLPENKEEKPMNFEHSQVSPAPVYPEPEKSQSYYPNPIPHSQPTPGPGRYNGGFQPPYSTTYQPQQPLFFVPDPSQSQQASQPNFPPPANAEPPVRRFVPAPPLGTKNPDKYPAGSQMLSPQGVALTPNPRAFMPVDSSVHPTPSKPSVALPPVQTVDTSNVPANQKPLITTLTRLFNETSEALGGANADLAKRRVIEDNSKKLGALFSKLNTGKISKNASDKLVQLCLSLDTGDYDTALQNQVQLTANDWEECNFWLTNLKIMIRARRNMR